MSYWERCLGISISITGARSGNLPTRLLPDEAFGHPEEFLELPVEPASEPVRLFRRQGDERADGSEEDRERTESLATARVRQGRKQLVGPSAGKLVPPRLDQVDEVTAEFGDAKRNEWEERRGPKVRALRSAPEQGRLRHGSPSMEDHLQAALSPTGIRADRKENNEVSLPFLEDGAHPPSRRAAQAALRRSRPAAGAPSAAARSGREGDTELVWRQQYSPFDIVLHFCYTPPMATKHPRIHTVLEPPLFEVVERLAKKDGFSLSEEAAGLIREAVALREDRALDRLGETRRGTFDRKKALSIADVRRRLRTR